MNRSRRGGADPRINRATVELLPSAPSNRRQRNVRWPFELAASTATASRPAAKPVSRYPSITRAPAPRAALTMNSSSASRAITRPWEGMPSISGKGREISSSPPI